MTDRLTEEELKRIVAEVESMARSQETDLSREQVREVLDELGFPADLLDDAIIQLRRQDALSAQTNQRKWLVAGVITAAVVGLAVIFFVQQQRQQVLSRLGVVDDQVTLGLEGNPVAQVSRQENSELFYQVKLSEAPIGKRLSLNCDWINPSGQTLHQNSYQTKAIKTSVWNTYCRYRVGAASEPGTWTVEMRLGDRVLERQTFQVKK